MTNQSTFSGGQGAMGINVHGKECSVQVEHCILQGQEVSGYCTNEGKGLSCFKRKSPLGLILAL